MSYQITDYSDKSFTVEGVESNDFNIFVALGGKKLTGTKNTFVFSNKRREDVQHYLDKQELTPSQQETIERLQQSKSEVLTIKKYYDHDIIIVGNSYKLRNEFIKLGGKYKGVQNKLGPGIVMKIGKLTKVKELLDDYGIQYRLEKGS